MIGLTCRRAGLLAAHGACRRALALASLLSAATQAGAASLTEADAIAAALARPAFQALEVSRRQVAEAVVEQASTRPNPIASIGREGFTTAGDRTIETSYEVSQQFDVAGRRRLAVQASRHLLDATTSDLLVARQDTITEVRKAFGATLYRARVVDALSSAAARLATTSRVVERLAAAGEASGYDRRRLRRELLTMQVKRDSAGADLARDRTVLASFLDAEAPQTLDPAGPALPATPPPIDSLLERIPQRPDLAALQARAEASAAELRRAERAWIPDLTLGVGNRMIETAAADNDRVMLSLSMPLPVFDRGAPAARRAAAEVGAYRAEYELRFTRTTAELRGAWQQAVALREVALDFRRGSLRGSRELSSIAEKAYAAGEASILELLDAWRTELDAALTSLELDHRARLARIELDQLAGVSLHD